MATVKDILEKKGAHIHTIAPEATVLEAATAMNDVKIGSLIVVDGGRLVGIFTERDILRRVVASGRDPRLTRVEDVMTSQVAACRPETTLDEARGVMKNRRIRHLPVVDDDLQLMGVISIGDLNAHEVTSQEITIHFLQEYLYGQT